MPPEQVVRVGADELALLAVRAALAGAQALAQRLRAAVAARSCP